MSELFSVSEETCATNVELALTAADQAGRHPIRGPGRWDGQHPLVAHGARPGGPTWPRGEALARYDARTLKVWSMNSDKFTSEDKRAELLRITGSLPSLVERAAELSDRHTTSTVRSRTWKPPRPPRRVLRSSARAPGCSSMRTSRRCSAD